MFFRKKNLFTHSKNKKKAEHKRAVAIHEKLSVYCSNAVWIKTINIELLDEENGIVAAMRDDFAKETNEEFDAYRKCPERVLMIAAIEHALGINHRQSMGSRIANTKVMGEHGRSVTVYSSTGCKFGGGVVSDSQKISALNAYESRRYDMGIGFQPICEDTLEVDGDYVRFPVNNNQQNEGLYVFYMFQIL